MGRFETEVSTTANNLGVFLQGTNLPEEMADWSAQWGADTPKTRTNPAAEAINHARFARVIPNYGTAGPRSLISAQGGRNMERSAIYLGNVGWSG